MDHYKVLGLSRNATKEEIKEAFRKLALKFHPDKHLQSSKAVRDGATVRFKQASDAYEVLIDDRKRAEYNRRSGSFNGGDGYGYYSGNSHRPRYRSSYASSGDKWVSSFDATLRFFTSRGFLLNLVFASILLGGTFMIDSSRDALWKMHNSGKSFEEAMESIEKVKTKKDEK